MGKVKSLMMETETMLVDCLDNWSMTNEQAFTKIGKELGHMAEQHGRDLVNQWRKEDFWDEYPRLKQDAQKSKGDQDGDCKI